ncbi:MAG: hypothetical protein WD711_11950 [Dongiaceae bacterium]
MADRPGLRRCGGTIWVAAGYRCTAGHSPADMRAKKFGAFRKARNGWVGHQTGNGSERSAGSSSPIVMPPGEHRDGIARGVVPDPAYSTSEGTTVMNSIIYMVGLVVIVLAILSFVGLA